MNLKDVGLNLSESDYRKIPCLSYSALSTYDREGYSCVQTIYEPISTPSLTFGSMVDTLVTQGEEAFNNMFVATDTPNVSDSLIAIVTTLVNERAEPQFALVPDDVVLQAANNMAWQSRWKDTTRIEKIRKEGSAYYNFMKQNVRKQIVSKNDMEDAMHAATVLKAHVFTTQFFTGNPLTNTERIYQWQSKMTDPVTGIDFKGMLDLIVIDHTRKTITPCDLKTTKSIYSFEDSFYKYRYYLQAKMYYDLLRNAVAELDKQDSELKGYSIEDYRFIAIDRNTFTPIVVKWEPTDYVKDPYGHVRKPYRQLLRELSWSLKNKDLNLPKDWYDAMESDGEITFNNYYNEESL